MYLRFHTQGFFQERKKVNSPRKYPRLNRGKSIKFTPLLDVRCFRSRWVRSLANDPLYPNIHKKLVAAQHEHDGEFNGFVWI